MAQGSTPVEQAPRLRHSFQRSSWHRRFACPRAFAVILRAKPVLAELLLKQKLAQVVYCTEVARLHPNMLENDCEKTCFAFLVAGYGTICS